MPRKPKKTKLQRFFSAINPTTPKKRFLLFIVIFMLIGGGYMAYRSFAFTTLVGSDGEFTSLSPARVLDTRTTIGGINRPIGQGQAVPVQIAGQGGVPAKGVRAVVMNVTVTNTTADSHVSVWPSGEGQPTSSNINFTAGSTLSNQATVKIGADGKVLMANSLGSTNVIFDVVGYYADASGTAGNRFNPVTPARILDTRTTTGNINRPIRQMETVPVQIAGQGGLPASGVKAVVMNVTVTSGTAPSFLTVWPTGVAKPDSSSLNFQAGQTLPNQVTVQVGADGKVQLYNHGGSTNVIFDVAGYFATETDEFKSSQAGRFVPITPKRIIDSRSGPYLGDIPQGAIGQGKTAKVRYGSAYYNEPNVKAVVLNVTVTNPTAESFLIIWPNGKARPNTSSLNFKPGQTIANQVTVEVGVNSEFLIHNAFGSTNVVIDVAGYYYADDYWVQSTGQVGSEVNVTNAAKAQMDFTVTSIPTKDPAAGVNLSFAGPGGGSTTIVYEKGVSKIRTTCTAAPGTCRLRAANGTKSGDTMHVPFVIAANTKYTLTQQLRTNFADMPGRWVITSIENAAGASSDLWATPVGTTNLYGTAGVIASNHITHFSCKSPQTLTSKVSNLRYNDAPVTLPNNALNNYFGTTDDTCKGIARVDYTSGLSSGNVLTVQAGVPKASRDLTAPANGTITALGANRFRVTTTDATAVTSLKVFFQNATNQFGAQIISDTGYGKSRTIEFYGQAGLTGAQPVRIVSQDNSGNQTETAQTINL